MVEAIRSGLTLAAVGGSFALTYRLGYVNLAHGDLVMFGGLVVWAGYTSLGGSLGQLDPAPLLLATVLAAGLAGALNVAIHVWILGPLVKRSLRMPQVLAGLGVSLALTSACNLAFGVQERSLPVRQTLASVDGAPVRASDLALLVGVSLAMLLALRFQGSLAYRAAAANRALAGLWGIQLNRLTRRQSFVGGACAALLGAVLVLADGVRAGDSLPLILLAFAGVVLGRHFGPLGAMLVPFGLGILDYGVARFVAPWVSTMSVMLLVVIVLVARGR